MNVVGERSDDVGVGAWCWVGCVGGVLEGGQPGVVDSDGVVLGAGVVPGECDGVVGVDRCSTSEFGWWWRGDADDDGVWCAGCVDEHAVFAGADDVGVITLGWVVGVGEGLDCGEPSVAVSDDVIGDADVVPVERHLVVRADHRSAGEDLGWWWRGDTDDDRVWCAGCVDEHAVFAGADDVGVITLGWVVGVGEGLDCGEPSVAVSDDVIGDADVVPVERHLVVRVDHRSAGEFGWWRRLDDDGVGATGRVGLSSVDRGSDDVRVVTGGRSVDKSRGLRRGQRRAVATDLIAANANIVPRERHLTIGVDRCSTGQGRLGGRRNERSTEVEEGKGTDVEVVGALTVVSDEQAAGGGLQE